MAKFAQTWADTSTLITASPTARVVTATRALVELLLALNTRNRKIRPRVVSHYADEITAGRWLLTHQGVGVSKSGVLIDGQHRLMAIRQAGYRPVQLLLVTGMDDEAAAAVDAGVTRRAADYLHFMFDISVGKNVQAILRTSLVQLCGLPSFLRIDPRIYAEHYALLHDDITTICAIPRASSLPAAVLASLVDSHHLGVRAVREFAEALISCEMLPAGHPALALRRWIDKTHGAGGAAQLAERYEKTTAGVMAYAEGRRLERVYRLARDPELRGKYAATT